jgi:membrane fusion protein (multidrug efflux system)
MTRHRLTAALTVALALLAGGCRRAPAAERSDEPVAVPVAAQPAKSGTLRAVIRVSGMIVPSEGGELLVVAPEPARLLEVGKAAGDTVASGDLLVRYELAGAVQEVARYRAELASVEADLENARAAQARTRDLVARGLIPRVDVDRADREFAEAQQTLVRAQTMFKAAETAAARAIVRAPFAGVVAARFHNPGDLVQPAATDPILRIVDPARVEILASVPAAEASRVLQGATARMNNPKDATTLPLTVVSRAPVAPATGMAPVRLLPAAPPQAPVDSTVAIEIDAEERANVVFVPPEIVIQDNGETVVMVAKGDRAERRRIVTGITTDAGVEVISGVQPGELVIVQGHIGLADGAVITAAVR